MPSTNFGRVFIIGCGTTAFTKPGGERTNEGMGLEAGTKALLDAGITYDAVEAAYVNFCYSESTSGQNALCHLGMTDIPVMNVRSTGSTLLVHAANVVRTSLVECALALGFERMDPRNITDQFPDRLGPAAPFVLDELEETHEWCAEYGGPVGHSAIASKNYEHASSSTPYTQFRDEWIPHWTEEQVLNLPQVSDQLTRLRHTSTPNGATCCILASEDFVHAHELENQAIEIVIYAPEADDRSDVEPLAQRTTAERHADQGFEHARFAPVQRPGEVGVIKRHDRLTLTELAAYVTLGICAQEADHRPGDDGAANDTCGGKYVIDPSGALEARGRYIMATGLRMYFSMTMHIRGWYGKAPNLIGVPDKHRKHGLIHNACPGGATVVSLLRRPEFFQVGDEDGRTRLGYNHATECRPITIEDLNKVKARKSSKYVPQAGILMAKL